MANVTYYECSYDIGVSVTQRRFFMTTNLILTFLLPLVVLVTAYTAIMRKLLADQSSKCTGRGGTLLQVKCTQTKTSNGCTTASDSASSSILIKHKSTCSSKKLNLVAKNSTDGTAVLIETASGSAENSPVVSSGGLRMHGGQLKSGSVVNLRKSATANRSKVKMLLLTEAEIAIYFNLRFRVNAFY